MIKQLTTLFFCLALGLLATPAVASDLLQPDDNQENFNDGLLETALEYPDWFRLSLGVLSDDIAAAVKNGKDGIIVYYGQNRCAYCQLFINKNLTAPDIKHTVQKHFDVIPVDIWGIDTIVDTNGTAYSERELAKHYKTIFTPSLVFYDRSGTAVFRLRGYHPPYQFRAALDYVIGQFYRGETFRDYLERAVPGMFFQEGGLNERAFFLQPPYQLDRLSADKNRPLVVFFEQGECHSCDLLHTGPLNSDDLLAEISKMNAVQLDMWSSTPVTTPSGVKTNAREWAKKLGLFYSPTLIFFAPDGKEILRVDSVVQFYRLWGVLDYINKRAYQTEPDYQEWRLKQRTIK